MWESSSQIEGICGRVFYGFNVLHDLTIKRYSSAKILLKIENL